jgi:hypothetical protein
MAGHSQHHRGLCVIECGLKHGEDGDKVGVKSPGSRASGGSFGTLSTSLGFAPPLVGELWWSFTNYQLDASNKTPATTTSAVGRLLANWHPNQLSILTIAVIVIDIVAFP